MDDAVGNLQSTADGFIIAVGGTANLPNPKPATKGIHVTFGPSTTVNGVTATFTQYGICTTDVTGPYVYDVPSTYQSFLIGSYDPASCPVSLKDNFGRIYTAKLDNPPFYPKKPVLCPPPNPTNAYCPGPVNYNAVDCSGNTGVAVDWCKNSQGIGAYAYTDPNPLSGHRDKNSENYLVLSAPANPPTLSSPPPHHRHGGPRDRDRDGDRGN